MQAARAYDTHRAIKKYISLGFSEEQSEGMVEESVNLLAQAQGDLATKSDIQAVRSELKSDIQAVRSELQEVKAELKSDIQEVRSELQEVKAELKSDIQEVKSDLRIEIRDMHSSLIRWFIGALLAVGGLILTALKLFL